MKIVIGFLAIAIIGVGVFNLTKKDDGKINNSEASVEAEEETTKGPPNEKASEGPSEKINEETAIEKGQPKEEVPKGENGYIADVNLDQPFPLKKDDRFFIDAKGNPLKEIPAGTRIVGEKSTPDWDQKLFQLLKSAPAFSKGDLAITKLDKKFIIVNGKTGFPVETAGIKFTAPDGAKMAYNAFVNGANGEMMLFFNTIHDWVAQKHIRRSHINLRT